MLFFVTSKWTTEFSCSAALRHLRLEKATGLEYVVFTRLIHASLYFFIGKNENADLTVLTLMGTKVYC